MQNLIDLQVFQSDNGSIAFKTEVEKDTIWASKKQIAELFGIDRSVVSKHIKNIFRDAELDEKLVCANFAQTTNHGALEQKTQTKLVEHYNLDIILAVGYRTNSVRAIKFRQWASQVLKDHLIQGYTLNTERLNQNRTSLLQVTEYLKTFAQNQDNAPNSQEMLSLVQDFSKAWFVLDNYDKNNFPQPSYLQDLDTSVTELYQALEILKADLIAKGQASPLFASEKESGKLQGIFGNVFQSIFGQDAYPSLEEKAAHLLYFIIKNHPFNDGNKRSAAFAFIWLLSKGKPDFRQQIKPETLSTLTLLVANSQPEDKDKIVGLVLLLLQSTQV